MEPTFNKIRESFSDYFADGTALYAELAHLLQKVGPEVFANPKSVEDLLQPLQKTDGRIDVEHFLRFLFEMTAGPDALQAEMAPDIESLHVEITGFLERVQAEQPETKLDTGADDFLSIVKQFPDVNTLDTGSEKHYTILGKLAEASGDLQEGLLVACLRAVLEARADPNCRCPQNKYTPLHSFASKCRRSVASDAVSLLLAARANPNLKTKIKNSVLDVAGQKKNLFVAEPLLEARGERDVFQWAAKAGVTEYMRSVLMKHVGQDVYDRIEPGQQFDVDSTNKLRAGCFKGKITEKDVQKLLEGNADPSIKNNYGETAFHYACKKCPCAIVEILLHNLADLQVREKDGLTPLHYAAISSSTDVVRTLLAARADITEEDEKGFTPWMLCTDRSTADLLAPSVLAEDVLREVQADAGSFLSKLADNAEGFNANVEKLRLRESLFFECTELLRKPRESLLLEAWEICAQFLRRTRSAPLPHNDKFFVRHLLLAMRGPQKNLQGVPMKMWPFDDNRECYREQMMSLIDELLSSFASECEMLRTEIYSAAKAGCKYCAEFDALPPEQFCVPKAWLENSAEWREADSHRQLRSDLPGVVPTDLIMGGVSSADAGASVVWSGFQCFLGLRRLGVVKSIQEYGDLVQELEDRGKIQSFAALNCMALVEYSKLANDRFHAAVERLLEASKGSLTEREALSYSRAPAKKFKRVWEKTIQSQREELQRQDQPALSKTKSISSMLVKLDRRWSFHHPRYEAATHCAHLQDMNRGTFLAKGDSIQKQVISLMQFRNWLRQRSLEADGAVVLREKSGYSASPVPGGYFDVKLIVLFNLGSTIAADGTEMPLRIFGELQLQLEGMQAVKDRMHLAYEMNRGSYEWPVLHLEAQPDSEETKDNAPASP